MPGSTLLIPSDRLVDKGVLGRRGRDHRYPCAVPPLFALRGTSEPVPNGLGSGQDPHSDAGTEEDSTYGVG
jgi:hypothetical protein